MTDLEILKELEKELGYSLKEGTHYDELNKTNDSITSLEFYNITLTSIPTSLLKLNFLKKIFFHKCKINDYSSLLKLKLKSLDFSFVDNKEYFYTHFLNSNIKTLLPNMLLLEEIIIRFGVDIEDDDIKLLFSLKERKFKKEDLDYKSLAFDNEDLRLPLLSMLSLGHKDINLPLDYFFKNPTSFLYRPLFGYEISKKLLVIFYKD